MFENANISALVGTASGKVYAFGYEDRMEQHEDGCGRCVDIR